MEVPTQVLESQKKFDAFLEMKLQMNINRSPSIGFAASQTKSTFTPFSRMFRPKVSRFLVAISEFHSWLSIGNTDQVWALIEIDSINLINYRLQFTYNKKEYKPTTYHEPPECSQVRLHFRIHFYYVSKSWIIRMHLKIHCSTSSLSLYRCHRSDLLTKSNKHSRNFLSQN